MQVKVDSPFRWETKALKYLGVWLTPKLTDTYGQNFPTFIKNMGEDLQRWQSGYFSWFGHAAIIKMTILPRLLYLLHVLPLKIPSSLLSSLRTILLKFLWNSQRPRIWYSLLTKPKDQSGMGIPDFKHYYQATHLTRVIDWYCHGAAKHWVNLEAALSPILLKYSPWVT